MQKAVWNGLGEGTSADPFILEVDDSFDINNSFNIKIESNFMGWQNEENYFRFSNSTTVYLLALVIKDENNLKYFMTKNAIEYTFVISDHMNINEGPFTVTSYLGVYYLLKQQIFSIQDMALEEVREIIKDLVDKIILFDFLDVKVAELLSTEESETRIAFDTIVNAKDISILNESKEYTDDEIIRIEQKVDTHLVDVDNPHGVTAEQVDTYNKTTIEQKDADTLQEAKEYTDDKLNEEITSEKVKQLYESNPDTNVFDDATKDKLENIENGAQVNVKSDWNATTGDAEILNKPAIPTKVSDLTNDTGYITEYTETDPIFTAWDKSTGISITKSQVSDLIEATQSLSGLMSATDKQRLDVLHALLEEDTENDVVDSINEVLAIFNNYPEGADLVTTLAGKVDKVEGKGLSTEDYTTAEKTKLSGIQAGAQVNPSAAQIKILYESNADTNAFTDTEKSKLSGIEEGAQVNTVDSVNGQTGAVVLDAEDVGALPDDTPLFSGDYDDLSNKPTIDQLLGNLSTLGFVKRTGTNTYVIDTSNYQPLDSDLTAIAGLSGTSGLLRKTASNTWQLDTSVYLTEITKLMVETVLTGTITTHTHNASEIVEDALHRFVTDAEKNTWSAKQNALGFTPENAANKKTTLTDSNVDYPTTKAVKAAIDAAISQTLKPMGNWNASTNTPELTDNDISKANQVYYVNVAGTQFGINFKVGDELVYDTNGIIFKRDNVGAVISVNGKEGVVVLTQDDIGDGSIYKRITDTEKATWNNKVDKVAGKGLSTEDYTTTEKNKLSSIEAGAQVNPTAAQIKTLYESNADTNAFTDTLKSKLEGIQAGAQVNPTAAQVKSLYESNSNTNAFTDAEKSKLASLESSKFRGQYESLGALEIAEPSPPIGAYAYVDEGEGVDVVKYLWDSSDEAWTLSSAVSQELTPSQVKDLYEANPDTNAFTDTEKSKLSNIEAGAQVNTVASVAGKTGEVILAADDILFDSSGTNYLVSETEVEGAIKKLDTQITAMIDEMFSIEIWESGD